MIHDDVISMPDKWEYPWYAAWDLAFHTMALSMVDVDFAKDQLALVLKDAYLHPGGQVPAYEWNFSDVNPPVHAWATLFLYNTEKQLRGKGDVEFLKRVFNKLALNFTWWVNRKDRFGKNVFEGGFLGLDNIGVFDRSAPLPTGGHLEQADGTAWMAMFCQNMLEIAVELATQDPAYEELAMKFAEHFFWIAAALNRVGGEGLWVGDVRTRARTPIDAEALERSDDPLALVMNAARVSTRWPLRLGWNRTRFRASVAVAATIPAPFSASAKFNVPIPPKVRATVLLAVLISLTSASSTVYGAFSFHSFPVSSTQFPFACC